MNYESSLVFSIPDSSYSFFIPNSYQPISQPWPETADKAQHSSHPLCLSVEFL